MTCIVVLQNALGVVVASDSRATEIASGLQAEDTVKTIALGTHAIFGVAIRPQIYAFNSMDAARLAFSPDEPLIETVDRYIRKMETNFMEQLSDYFRDSPAQASAERGGRGLLPEPFFACVEDGYAKSFQLDFELTGEHPSLGLNVRRSYSPNGPAEGLIYRGFFAAAQAEALRRGANNHLPGSLSELADMARGMVVAQILATPTEVGPPVTVTTIDAAGTRVETFNE